MEIQKKIKLLNFKLTKNLWASLFWVYKSSFKWNWIDFIEHRQYIYWDPIKNIDRKVSARTDKVYSKIFEEERDLNLLLVLDTSESMYFWSKLKTKIDILEEIFYSIAFSAYQNNDSIWAYIYDEKSYELISYKKWIWNIFSIIKKIEEKDLKNKLEKSDNTTKQIIEKINKLNIKNNLIFIITDNTEIENEYDIKLLSSDNQVIYINIFDHFENNLENIKSNVSINFWTKFLNIKLSDSEKIENYKKLRQEKLKKLKNILEKNKIWYLNIDTQKDHYKELYSYFSKI